PHLSEEFACVRVEPPKRRVRLPEAVATIGPRLKGQHDVLDDPEVLEETRDLERAGHSALCDLIGAQAGRVLTEEQEPAARWGEEAGQQIEERGLPFAVRSDERVHDAFLEPQVDVVHRAEAGEILAQRMRLDRVQSAVSYGAREGGRGAAREERPRHRRW